MLLPPLDRPATRAAEPRLLTLTPRNARRRAIKRCMAGPAPMLTQYVCAVPCLYAVTGAASEAMTIPYSSTATSIRPTSTSSRRDRGTSGLMLGSGGGFYSVRCANAKDQSSERLGSRVLAPLCAASSLCPDVMTPPLPFGVTPLACLSAASPR